MKAFVRCLVTSKEASANTAPPGHKIIIGREILKIFLSCFTDEMTYYVQVTDKEAL